MTARDSGVRVNGGSGRDKEVLVCISHFFAFASVLPPSTFDFNMEPSLSLDAFAQGQFAKTFCRVYHPVSKNRFIVIK